MKYILFMVCLVITATLSTAESDKIYIREHKTKPLIKIVNTYDQAIYCLTMDNKGIKDFYVQANSESIPLPKDKKLWCKKPDEKV